jgi:pimeloyl-ACP methyl ester carboxylesterase
MTKTVEANGLTFGYLEAGRGPLALCLHGFPDSAHTWRHLLPALADAGYRAVAPFQRGYAPTSVPADGAYQTGALAADANALHEALGGGDDAVLVGHDWGALATYAALAHAPSRWRRAVALSVPPLPALAAGFLDYDQLKRSFYLFLLTTPLGAPAVAADGMAFLDRLWADWSPGYDATEDLAYAKASLCTPANLEAAVGYYAAMFGLPSPAYAAEQASAGLRGERPVLYLHGDDDGCLAAAPARDVERHLPPGSRARMVPGAGHFPHLERPDAVSALVVEWLTA